MVQQRIRLGLIGAALALVLVVALVISMPRMGPLVRALSAVGGRPQAAASPAGAAAASLPEEPSRLADSLGAPGSDIHADLRLVNAIFVAYRGALRTGNPVGENSEITAALTGKNRLGFAFIPKDNPAINAKGELCDRWGTPFFFHQLSGEKMEIRSAGADRRMWTRDDEVLTP